MNRLDEMATEYIIDLFAASSAARAGSGATWFKRGFEYVRSMEFGKAVHCYTKAIEINPEYKEVYFGRGNAYTYLFLFAEAIEDFTWAVHLDPEHADAYYCLGLDYFLMGTMDEAKACFKKACVLGLERACAKLESIG